MSSPTNGNGNGNGNGKSLPDTWPTDIQSAAHEMRTPLTAILGYVDLLRFDDISDDKVERGRILDHIVANAMTESRIIDRWLDGDGPGSVPLRTSIIDLRKIVCSLLQDIDPLLDGRSVTIAIDEHVFVVAERDVFREILSNLVTNAVKYSGSSSPITVNATIIDGFVLIGIQNLGAPIADMDRERIFERGYRVPHDRDRPGSGLGLSITRNLVTRLGGTIWAENNNGGALFLFTLPGANMAVDA